MITLHQFEVLAHKFFSHIVTSGWIMFVNVHALKLDRLAVDKQCGDWATAWRFLVEGLDFDAAETHILWHKFLHLAVLLDAHHQFIQVWSLRRPCLNRWQLSLEANMALGIVLSHHVGIAALHHCALGVDELVCHSHILVGCAIVSHVHTEAEHACGIGIIEGRNHLIVVDLHLWLSKEIYIAFNTADAPEVLTFEERAYAVAIDFECQAVFAVLQIIVDAIAGIGL